MISSPGEEKWNERREEKHLSPKVVAILEEWEKEKMRGRESQIDGERRGSFW